MHVENAGKPAVHKLRLLTKVEDVLSTQRLQNELLDGGLLGEWHLWFGAPARAVQFA